MNKLVKIFVLGLLSLFPVWTFSNFNPGDTFFHTYTIRNDLDCPIKITNVTKCWDAPSTNPAGINPFSNIKIKSGVYRSSKSGCFSYSPWYPVWAHSSDSGWDITFFTTSNMLWAKVTSSMQYSYEIIWNCKVIGGKTKTSVNSSIVWQPTPPAPRCWDNVVNQSWEQCDDWNTRNWDWCSSICKLEPAKPICWDWHLDNNEQCDDWKNWNWDGCNNSCNLEPVWVNLNANPSSGEAPLTTQLSSSRSGTSRYDYLIYWDWDRTNGPAFPIPHRYNSAWQYTARVHVTNKYSWPTNAALPTASAVTTINVNQKQEPVQPQPSSDCWNRTINAGEECDDWNNTNRDWCSSSCKLEPVWVTLNASKYNAKESLTTTFHSNKESFAKYTKLRFGDWAEKSNPRFPTDHTYSRVWQYSATVFVISTYSW